MVSVNEFKKGMTIELDKEIYSIIEYQRVKPGKGGAFLRTKLKNLRTGYIQEKTFRTEDKVEKAHLESRQAQYLYREGNKFHFMDNETYEQISLNPEELGEAVKFLKENINVNLLSHKGSPVEVELPIFVELKVVQTEPGIKGNTASGGSKPATLEAGIQVQVPLFINIGDILKIDTRKGKYTERMQEAK
jgi:elongation factor P